MEEHISFFLETNNTLDESLLTVWDALKAYLRGQIISFTANMKRKSLKEQSDLLFEIRDTDKEYAQHRTPKLYNKKIDLKTRFDLLTTHQIQNITLKNFKTA